MAKTQLMDLLDEMLEPFFQEHGYRLWSKEFRKEGKDWVLRIMAERSDLSPVDTDDCEAISRYLSKKLDEQDPIEQNYILEVSSPGMDRTLKTEEQYRRYIGTLVDVTLYKAQDGSKQHTGLLKQYDAPGSEGGGRIVIEEDGQCAAFLLEEIAATRLTVVF